MKSSKQPARPQTTGPRQTLLKVPLREKKANGPVLHGLPHQSRIGRPSKLIDVSNDKSMTMKTGSNPAIGRNLFKESQPMHDTRYEHYNGSITPSNKQMKLEFIYKSGEAIDKRTCRSP